MWRRTTKNYHRDHGAHGEKARYFCHGFTQIHTVKIFRRGFTLLLAACYGSRDANYIMEKRIKKKNGVG